MVEVKRARGGLPSDLKQTVCAFANMPDGATILLGIDEPNNFEITGIENPATIEAGAVAQARSSITPSPYLTTYSVPVEGKQVVVIEVAPLPLPDRPCTIDGRAYLRQADGDYVMQEHELRMIEAEKTLLVEPREYDGQKVDGLTVDDLDAEILERYLVTARSRDQRLRDATDEGILRWTGVLVSSGEPTLAGLYAMGSYPQGIFPSLTVPVAVQLPSGVSGERNRDLQHFTGPVPVLLDEIMKWCSANLALVRAYREDGHMEERSEVPLNAVRELVANALVHRDLGPNTLGIGKSVQIRLTAQNLFIQSPGGLRGVSVEQLISEDHAQAAVNQKLYGIAQKLRTADGSAIIEDEGGGLREVFRSADRFGLPTPTLINTGVQFKALLWRPVSSADSAPRQARVLARSAQGTPHGERPVAAPTTTKNESILLSVLARHGGSSLRALEVATGLSYDQIRYALTNAIERGVVRMVGGQGHRTTTYELVDPD